MSPSVEFSLFFIFFYYFSIQIHNSFVYVTFQLTFPLETNSEKVKSVNCKYRILHYQRKYTVLWQTYTSSYRYSSPKRDISNIEIICFEITNFGLYKRYLLNINRKTSLLKVPIMKYPISWGVGCNSSLILSENANISNKDFTKCTLVDFLKVY